MQSPISKSRCCACKRLAFQFWRTPQRGAGQGGDEVEAVREGAGGRRIGEGPKQAPEHRDRGQRRQAACAQNPSLSSLYNSRDVASISQQPVCECCYVTFVR